MKPGFAGLREADSEGKDEEEGKHGNDALKGMKFPLHCGESSLAGGLFVIGCPCPIWSMGFVALCPTLQKNANKIS